MLEIPKKKIEYMRLLYEKTSQSRVFTNPAQKINEYYITVDNIMKNLENSINIKMKDSRGKSTELIAKLDTLSPLKTLTRGYSVVENVDGQIVKKVSDVNKNDDLCVILQDGKIQVKVK